MKSEILVTKNRREGGIHLVALESGVSLVGRARDPTDLLCSMPLKWMNENENKLKSLATGTVEDGGELIFGTGAPEFHAKILPFIAGQLLMLVLKYENQIGVLETLLQTEKTHSARLKED